MLDAIVVIDRFLINTSIRENKILQLVPNYTVDFLSVSIEIPLHNHQHRHHRAPKTHNSIDDVDLQIYSTKFRHSIGDGDLVLFAVLLVRFLLFPISIRERTTKSNSFSNWSFDYVTNI